MRDEMKRKRKFKGDGAGSQSRIDNFVAGVVANKLKVLEDMAKHGPVRILVKDGKRIDDATTD